MTRPARAGALIYAKDLSLLSNFYQKVLGMKILKEDLVHHVIESDDIQLIIHAIPSHISNTFSISSPPEPRSEQSIKLFFTVPSISATGQTVSSLGGALFGDLYTGPGINVINGYDPEGNIFHIREMCSN